MYVSQLCLDSGQITRRETARPGQENQIFRQEVGGNARVCSGLQGNDITHVSKLYSSFWEILHFWIAFIYWDAEISKADTFWDIQTIGELQLEVYILTLRY